MGNLVRVAVTLVVVLIFCGAGYWTAKKVWDMWKPREVDLGVSVRLAGKLVAKPVSTLTDLVRERPELQLLWEPQDGYAFDLKGGEEITTESRVDFRQYLLTILNASKVQAVSAELSIQLPVYISSERVVDRSGADSVDVNPGRPMMKVVTEGAGASVKISPGARIMSRTCKLKIVKLAPTGGRVAVLFDLNAWADADDKPTFPKERDGTYHYVLADMAYDIDGETFKDSFYAPFSLSTARSVAMGDVVRGDAVPKVLMVQQGFVMMK